MMIPDCPMCGRRWVRHFVWDHDRTTCALGNAQDATTAADNERLASRTRFFRDTTDAEAILVEHVTGHGVIPETPFRAPDDPIPSDPAPKTEVVSVAPGILNLIVAGVDLEVLNKEEEE